MPDELEIWTVYYDPADYPGRYVVRLYLNDQPTDHLGVGLSLLEVRAFIPKGLHRMPRNPGDHPSVVETWF